jgi:hypothetical protein
VGSTAARLGLAVGLVATVVLTAVGAGNQPTPPYPRDQVKAATLRAPGVATFLRGRHWTDVKVIPLDRTHWRVTIQDGPRSLLDASLDRNGRVVDIASHLPGVHPPGSRQVWDLPVLLLLTAVFCAATAVVPLRSLRNLDVAVLGVGLLISLLFYDDRLVSAHVYVGTAALLYIALRAAAIGLRPAPRPAGRQALWRHMTKRLQVGRRARWLAVITIALGFLGALCTYTSTGLSDVAFAGLAGATALTHGLLPYGHVTSEVVHGDTYPLLTYVLYLPFALISPVDDSFDDMQGSLDLNTIALLLVAYLVYRVGRRERSPEAGLLLACAWLAFPAVVLAASGGGNDVPATVFLAAGLALWTRPAWSVLMLSTAGWVKIVPGVALAARLPSLRGRELAAGLGVIAATCFAVFAVLVGVGGADGPGHMVDALRFQVERGSYHSLWKQIDAPLLQRMFEGATLAFIAVTAYVMATRRELAADLSRVAALLAADVLFVQLAGNYWTAAYLPWAMPLILVGLFLAPTATGADRADSPPRPRSRQLAQPVP